MNEHMITGVPAEFKTSELPAVLNDQELIEADSVPTEQLKAGIVPETTRRDIGRRVVVLEPGQFKGDPSRVPGHPAQQEKLARDLAAMTGYYVPPQQ